MAGPLTWRNVNDPNFGTAIDGTRIAAQLLNNAASGFSGGLGQFDAAQKQIADQQVLTQAMQYQNPEDYQAALAAGRVTQGVNPANVTPEALRTLQARTGQLIGNAVAGQGLKENQYTFGRKTADDASIDAARPDINRMLALSASGDQVGANEIARSSPALQGMDPRTLNTMLNNATGQVAGNVGNRNSSYNLGQRMQNDAEERQAQAAFGVLERESVDPASARTALDRQNLPPAIRARVENMASSKFGPLYGPINSTDVGTSGVAGTSQGSTPLGTGPKTGFGAVYGGAAAPPKPITNMTIKEAADWAKDTLIPATKGKIGLGADIGTSAIGGFQFTHNTLREYGPKVFGKDWESTTMTPENQDKLGKALFDDRKGGNLNDTWKALPNTTPGAYKDASWDTMRNVIAAGESGTDLRNIIKQADVTSKETNLNLNLRNAQNLQGTPANRIAAAASNVELTPSQASEQLIKNDLPGGEDGQVLRLVNEVIDKSKVKGQPTVNAAQAAEIIRTSLQGDGGPGIINALGRTARKYTPGMRSAYGGRLIDEDLLQNGIDLAKNGTVANTAIANQGVSNLAQTITNARDTLTAETTSLAGLQQRARSQPGLQPLVLQQQAKVAAAQKAFDDAAARQQSNANFAPVSAQPNPNQAAINMATQARLLQQAVK